MSPTLLAALLRAEREVQLWRMASRRDYAGIGYPPATVRYYSARVCWPDACQLVKLNGIRPYS